MTVTAWARSTSKPWKKRPLMTSRLDMSTMLALEPVIRVSKSSRDLYRGSVRRPYWMTTALASLDFCRMVW